MNRQILLFTFVLQTNGLLSAQETWQGLVVEPENRCSTYDKKTQYPYPQSLEDKIIATLNGKVYGPYTGRYFESDTETDIEHIVAASEGHDSGLCSASATTRKEFATDLLNLTLAAPEINRCSIAGKCGKDAAEWLPLYNRCWFTNRIIQIKSKYQLSIDYAEKEALRVELSGCESYEMIYFPETPTRLGETQIDTAIDALELYDDNNNGRITCSEARAHGISPVRATHPAYEFMIDSDGDGVVCG